uniref:Uncharacterized protein n=1 Tax=Panagrolaimus davidi TaxID=227884 RepID=A0A914PKB9_9BILA
MAELAEKGFACPVATNHKITTLYCYYQLPEENETVFLPPSNIPEKCNKIIIKGAAIVSGTVEFANIISKKTMINLRQHLSFNRTLIGSLKLNESTLIANILKYVDTYKLDGLEIDCEILWEIESFNTFLNNLKAKLGSSKVFGIQIPLCQDSHYDESEGCTHL